MINNNGMIDWIRAIRIRWHLWRAMRGYKKFIESTEGRIFVDELNESMKALFKDEQSQRVVKFSVTKSKENEDGCEITMAPDVNGNIPVIGK